MKTRNDRARAGRRGGALVMALVAASVLAGLSLAVVSTTLMSAREQRVQQQELHAQYVCEAGLSDAMADLKADGTGNLGGADAPIAYGGSSYWVQADTLSPQLLQLVSTGTDAHAGARAELILQMKADTIFVWGVFGDKDVVIDSNAFVDSYNSLDGTYASQAVNTEGGTTYAGDGGNIGSNEDVLVKQNATVMGSAVPGPESTTTILGNATVSGSTMPAPEAQTMPPITVPVIASSGPLTVNSGTTLSLAPGSYHYDATLLKTGAKIVVQGPAKLVLDSFVMKSNAVFEVDATGGPVEIWVINDFVLNSNTLMASTTKTPSDLKVNLLSDNVIAPEVVVDLDDVDFDSNAKMYGTIYAPNAAIDIDSNFELFGALIADSVNLDSNCKIHYDEALGLGGEDVEIIYSVLSWRLLPWSPE